ncbi:CobW family GTP-binding protein [Paenibacillus marinisediminis]
MNQASINLNKDIPVIILAGFLGSGKTTFLQQAVQRCLEAGQTPAVIMNEVGDVNLDGQLLPDKVAMEELLSGCICCSIRDDFGVKLYELVSTQSPDVIIVECTGIAEPMELVDTLTEVSLYAPVQLTHIITIVDTAHMAEHVFLEEGSTRSKKLERLLREQVRAANLLVLNKCDLISSADAARVECHLQEWNSRAHVHRTSHAEIPLETWEQCLLCSIERGGTGDVSETLLAMPNDKHIHDHSQHVHASHAHVTVWTHPIERPVDSLRFEEWLMALPQEVYRAKGIVRFTDTSKRYMFQYAYRATQFIPIQPQGDIEDVLVLIGEQMDARVMKETFDKVYDNDSK